MSKRRKFERTYEYNCTITGDKFRTTREALHPGELVSVKAYYELHPDKDDRPEVIKMELKRQEEEAKKLAEAQGPENPAEGAFGKSNPTDK